MDRTKLDNYTARNFLEQAADPENKNVVISLRESRTVGIADPTIVDSFELTFGSKWEGYTLKLSTAFGEVVAYLFSGRPWTYEPVFISSQVNQPFHKYILDIWEKYNV